MENYIREPLWLLFLILAFNKTNLSRDFFLKCLNDSKKTGPPKTIP